MLESIYKELQKKDGVVGAINGHNLDPGSPMIFKEPVATIGKESLQIKPDKVFNFVLLFEILDICLI